LKSHATSPTWRSPQDRLRPWLKPRCLTGCCSILELLAVLRSGDLTRFDAVLDVPGVLSYLAANVALGNYDYYASFGHNYYLYEITPGRFTMVA